MRDIESFIDELQLKKAVIGGFDKESVFTSMQELSSIYQKDIFQLRADKEKLERELRKTAEELELANREMQLLKFQLDEEQKHRNEYDVRLSALTQATDTVNASKEKIIEESRRSAAEIIAKANEKAENARQDCYLQKQQKELVISRIADAKQQFNNSLMNLRSNLTGILSEIDDLRTENLEKEPIKAVPDVETDNCEPQMTFNERTSRIVRKVAGRVCEHDCC